MPQMGIDSEAPENHLRKSAKSAVSKSSDGKGLSLFFDDLLDAKVREFNPSYADAEGALLGQFRQFHADIYGNREFIEHLRNRGKFLGHDDKREPERIPIDHDDPRRPAAVGRRNREDSETQGGRASAASRTH
jgi:type I restriction enzyme R subunit